MNEKQLLHEYINTILESTKLNEVLEVHDTLNPALWEGNQLKEDVKQSLIEIANNFIDNLGFPIDVVDIRFLGSNASYNYNNQSDIDLHIITNFDNNYVDDTILQQLYNNEKNSFNNKHNITVKGIQVELYVEDMKSMNATNGSYSLLHDEWVKEPTPINYEIPDYSEELNNELNKANNIIANATTSKEVKDEINHIYLMRKDGLAVDGEASIGNLVFKELRNLGIQTELANKFYDLESNELSLESENLTEEITYRIVDFNELLKVDPDLEYELESRSENNDYRLIYKRFLRSKTNKLRLNYYQLDLIAYIYEEDSKYDQIAEILYGKQVNEWTGYNDVTPHELSTNPCKFIVINQQTGDRSEDVFDNLRGVFTYVSQCGGFNTFKGLYWCIMSDYKDGEFYYVRDRFAKGGWRWEDCNGDTVGGFQSRNVGSRRRFNNLKEYHDYMNLVPHIEHDQSDEDSVNYWKEQIKKGNHRPILLNIEDNEIMDGNHTMVAYQELGIEPPYVYQGTRDEFFKHVIATKDIDALVAVKDMVADGTAELLEQGEETSEDIEIREFVRTIRDAYGKNYKIPDRAGYNALKNIAKSAQKIIDARQSNQNDKTKDTKKDDKTKDVKKDNTKKTTYIKPKGKIVGYVPYKNNNFLAYFENGGTSVLSYNQIKPHLDYQDLNDKDREDFDLDHMNESIKSDIESLNSKYKDVLVGNINSFKNRQYSDDKKSKYVTTYTATIKHKPLNISIYAKSIDELQDKINKALNSNLNESEQLNEYTITDVINDSKSSDPRRIELAKSLYTEYKGVDSDGTLLFETDSQTRSGLGHKQQIFYPGFFDMLDKVDQNEAITEEDVVNILTGDLSLKCSCESFLYFAWAYKSWKNDYGLMKETRAPKRNNVNLNGGACKHCLSVLELINRSNTLFDKIAKDLNTLFQHYKKQDMTQKEIERLQNELKNMKSPDLKSQDNNDNISDTSN